jgi:hypothetical protein
MFATSTSWPEPRPRARSVSSKRALEHVRRTCRSSASRPGGPTTSCCSRDSDGAPWRAHDYRNWGLTAVPGPRPPRGRRSETLATPSPPRRSPTSRGINPLGNADMYRVCVGTAALSAWTLTQSDPVLYLLRPDGWVFSSSADGAANRRNAHRPHPSRQSTRRADRWRPCREAADGACRGDHAARSLLVPRPLSGLSEGVGSNRATRARASIGTRSRPRPGTSVSSKSSMTIDR